MRHLQQLMIILMAYILGAIGEYILKIPIPATVLGLIILFLGLYIGFIKIEMIEDMCDILISHMSFLFIPAGVGLITSFAILKKDIIPLLIIIFVSTIVVWTVTAYVVKLLRKVCSK